MFYASNQGVYTLFFALDGLIGAILACVSHGEGTLFVVGNTLAIFATASMLCAALVLFITSKEHHSAAIKQGMFPLDCGGRPRDWAGNLKGENVHITKWTRTLTPSVIRYEA